MEMVSFYIADGIDVNSSKDHAVLNYRKHDNKGNTIEKEILYTPADNDSKGLTFEKAVQIIEESKTAASDSGVSRSRYILDELDKIQLPETTGINFVSFVYKLKNEDDGISELLSYDSTDRDKLVLYHTIVLPDGEVECNHEIIYDHKYD